MNVPKGLREVELIERLGWFIKVRWLAVCFIVAAAAAARLVLAVDFPLAAVLAVTAVIALYNLGFALYKGRIQRTTVVAVDLPRRAARFTALQAAADLIALLLVIHFTGGASNPFLFYFIFHTVITAILLPRRASFVQSALVCAAVAALLTAEYAGAAPHHPFGDLFPRHVHSDGRYLLVLYFVFASSILFTTHIASNISERLAEREEELRAKSRQLEAALAELREKDRLKSEYVRVVAHDMKSPLASALSLISVLLGGYAGPLEPKAREVVERMGRKLEYLHHYAKDLLDLSRMRSARFLSLQPVEIAPLVEEALALAAAKKEDKRINIVVDTSTAPKEITADREQLLHVLINLVANALKYTPDGGAVTIRAATEADRLRIDVSDTGIGIPPDELPRIFDEFYRGRNVAKTTKGTGLGLALVKEMVERHGGSVSVESRPHQGTRFTVKMPLRQEPLAPDRRDGL